MAFVNPKEADEAINQVMAKPKTSVVLTTDMTNSKKVLNSNTFQIRIN